MAHFWELPRNDELDSNHVRPIHPSSDGIDVNTDGFAHRNSIRTLKSQYETQRLLMNHALKSSYNNVNVMGPIISYAPNPVLCVTLYVPYYGDWFRGGCY